MLIDTKKSDSWDKFDCLLIYSFLNIRQKEIEVNMLSRKTTNNVSYFTKLCSAKVEVIRLKEELTYTIRVAIETKHIKLKLTDPYSFDNDTWITYHRDRRRFGCLRL